MTRRFVFVLCLLATAAFPRLAEAQAQGSCIFTETCKCRYDNGYTIDLTPLDSVGSPRFESVSDGEYFYDVNLCSSFSMTSCTGVTVCQSSADGAWTYSCGVLSGASFSTEGDTVYYTFDGGEDGRKSKIQLSCDQNDEGTMFAYGDGPVELEYDFTLYSRYACPLDPGEGPPDPDPDPDPDGGGSGGASLSPGSILLIVVFALLVTYFIVGTLVLKVGLHAEGREIVPQVVFWTAIPGLIKDGVLFICNKIRGRDDGVVGGGGGDAKYDKL
ncbi:uncharacterized protein [Oscarella lobularis]|uniref:uncharacterized protein isoform X3 n=1 Tax=Oscarella lobularis TaxID=121494 RepID=UPI0033143C1C